MSACLCLHISSDITRDKQELNFFVSNEWTSDSEAELIYKVKELLGILRPMGKSLSLHIELTVSDTVTAAFLANKRFQQPCEINHQKLSIREIEILGLIMQGFTNNEIAEKLFISYETVKSHRKNILEKTGAKNTASLISYYHQTFFEK